jgi:hypothetical protein
LIKLQLRAIAMSWPAQMLLTTADLSHLLLMYDGFP